MGTEYSDPPTAAELIAEVRELDAKATPGPWTRAADDHPRYLEGVVCSLPETELFRDRVVARANVYFNAEADETFIARSRTLLVQLADALERESKGQDYWRDRCREQQDEVSRLMERLGAARAEAHGFDLVNSMLLDENRGLEQKLADVQTERDQYKTLLANWL